MKKNYTKNLVMLAMFSALAYVCTLVFSIGGIGGFLTFDLKDAVIAIAAMIYGPLAGLIISFLVSFVEMFTSVTGWIGFLMNFISTAVFVCSASVCYRYIPKLKKSLNGAIIALSSSVVLSTAVMLLVNIFITPIYMKTIGIPMTSADIIAMIPTVLLPFNLVKCIMNAAIVLVLYKPISTALKKARVIDGGVEKYKFDKTSVFLTVVGGLIIIGCAVVFIVLMDGSFSIV